MQNGWGTGRKEEEKMGQVSKDAFHLTQTLGVIYMSGVRILTTVLSSVALRIEHPLLKAICSKWGLICSQTPAKGLQDHYWMASLLDP